MNKCIWRINTKKRRAFKDWLSYCSFIEQVDETCLDSSQREQKRTEKEAAVMQKHWFNLQSTRYFCTSVECMWSVLNHSYASHTRLTFRVLGHAYETRVEGPTLYSVHKVKKETQRSMGLLVPSPLDIFLGWEFSVKKTSWYILWDVWKIDSNKYIILCGRWIIQCLRTWTGE